MRPIINMPEEDRATDIGNIHMHKKVGKDRAYDSENILADRQTDRQTDTQTDIFITILRNRCRSNEREDARETRSSKEISFGRNYQS